MRVTAVTPYLAITGAAAAIDWYRDVFAAEEVLRWHDPDGRISHAEIRVGGAPIFLADEHPELEHIVGPLTLGGSPTLLDLDVDDVEGLFVPVLMHRLLFRPSYLAEIRDRGWAAAALDVRARCLALAPKPGFDIDLDVPAAAVR